MHIQHPTDPRQYVSAQAYQQDGGILIGIGCHPMNASIVLPMDQALLLADLIYEICGANNLANNPANNPEALKEAA